MKLPSLRWHKGVHWPRSYTLYRSYNYHPHHHHIIIIEHYLCLTKNYIQYFHWNISVLNDTYMYFIVCETFIIQYFKKIFEFTIDISDSDSTHLWYCACRKLNSSFMRSQDSATVNLNGCPGWGPWGKGRRDTTGATNNRRRDTTRGNT